MHATKIADRWQRRVGVAQRDDMHRVTAAGYGHFAGYPALQKACAQLHDALQSGEFG
jgi:hypothetical protein